MPLTKERAFELAHAEAAAALSEGWRAPMLGNVPKLGGQSRLGGANAKRARLVFEEWRVKQEFMIRDAADQLREDGEKVTIDGIAAILNIAPRVIYLGHVKGKGRFVEVLDEVLTPRKPRNGVGAKPLHLVMRGGKVERNCRCQCADRTDGAQLINGYLPGCWAEYQRRKAADERINRRTA